MTRGTHFRRTAALAATALLTDVGAVPVAAQRVDNNLPVGACVSAYGSAGRIVDHVQGGYRIAKDDDPNGTPFVAAAASVEQHACAGPAAPPRTAAAPPFQRAPMAPRQAPAMAPAGRGGGCFASSAAAMSGQALSYAQAVIGNWAAPARPGSDGAVTVRVERIRIGAARRATLYDRDNEPLDARAPVTPIVVNATMCTDYRTEVSMHQVEENFLCYTRAIGGLACGETGHTADLRQPRDWSIPK